MRRFLTKTLQVLAITPALAVVLSAQARDTSVLVGHITDATELPIAGVSLTVRSPALIGGDRLATTEQHGSFRVAGLPAGVYELRVSYPGFAPVTRTGITLASDETLTVDVQLALTPVEQRVSVDVPALAVDVTTASKAVRFDRLLLENLPTDRNLSNVMNLAPGINGSIGLGGVQQSNPLLVEDVNTAEIQTLGPWATFNYNWIEEVQVVGPGAGVEYDDYSGVVQRSRLRSGGDALRGSAEARTTQPRWLDVNTESLDEVTRQGFQQRSQRILTSHDESMDIGGPLRRQRVWGFGGLQAVRRKSQPALYQGPDSVDGRDRRILARLDTAPAAALRIGGFYEYDRHFTQGSGLGPLTPLQATSTDLQPSHTWSVDGKWTSGRSMLDLTLNRTAGTLSSNPTSPQTRSGPYPHTDLVTGTDSGNLWQYFDVSNRRTTVGGVFTREQMLRQQAHSFQVGAQLERSQLFTRYGFPGGRAYLDLSGVPYQAIFWDGAESTKRIHRLASHLQDRWTIGAITLQPGLRVSRNGGFVSQGRVLGTTAVSPRLGVAWDLSHAHNTVLSAHAGRYVDAVLTPNFGFADATLQPPQVTMSVLGPAEFSELYRSSSTANTSLDPEISQAYFTELLGGVEHAVSKSLAINAQVLARRYRNFLGMIDTGSIYVPLSVPDPGPDNVKGTFDDAGMITVYRKTNPGHEQYLFTNPSGAYRNYTALQFIARYKPAAATEVHASYSWSRTRGNVENTTRANSAGPELWTNGVFSDPNRAIYSEGPATFDFTHDVKVLGTAHLPWVGGFTLSGVYRYHTGIAWARSVQNPGGVFVLYGVHVETRGTRRTPALNTVDLRLEKTFPLGASRRAGLFVDGFNLTNQGIPDPASRRAVFEVSGPSFGVPLNWVDPRSARAGVRIDF